MSSTPITILNQVEKPLDRLNYFNGQRLEAADLKLEQQYQIRVRRWLNKSLYTTGIARGLEVVPDPGNSLNVIVNPGLALDSQGREIILLDQVSVAVVGTPRTQPDVVKGNYLTIQYNEQTIEDEQDGCTVHVGNKKGCGCGCGNGQSGGKSSLAWGGPAFIRPAPILGFSDYLPSDTSGKIVLAQIELMPDCTVASVHPETRRYVGAASAAKVYQYALEGEREITSGDGNAGTENYTTIYFHIRGREPNAVTLYLRGDTFRTLHYTEMGEHSHSASITGTTGNASPPLSKADTKHAHGQGASVANGSLVASAGPSAGHNHALTARAGYVGHGPRHTNKAGFVLSEDGWIAGSVPGTPENILDSVNGTIDGGDQHSHTITGNTEEYAGFDYDHTHTLSGSGSSGPAGVTDPAFPPGGAYSARSGSPLTYVNELQIIIDDVPQTDNILTQLTDSDQFGYDWNNGKLGNGTANHPLVDRGAGPIKLDFLPLLKTFTEGPHTIEIHTLRKKDANGNRTIPTGGRIFYNLYIE